MDLKRVLIGISLALICGCSAVSGGTAVVSYEQGKDLVLTEAPTDGTYVLFDTYLDSRPKAKVALMKGTELGFKFNSLGNVVAVAGRKEIPLADGNYIWKKQK
jgi:hypothetical protein